ncbi:MAG TPA: NADH-quinone oxidoreductase subunit L [Verrucomicrobiales bacterium]|nr:NADH-quinone oxidoreductase subunit L [Verrucomicrobiales bacterium]
MELAAWLIFLLPLISAVTIGIGAFRSKPISAGISIAAVVGSFILTFVMVATGSEFPDGQGPSPKVSWLQLDGLSVDIGLKIDGLSKLMLCVVTGVGSMIHIFSLGYMKEDRDFSRYFAFLSLFIFSMLGIVLADNFVMMFIFWELVGVSSYLLIGFWFDKPSAADAAKKAFMTNRVGDFGFLLGILMVWAAFGSVSFDILEKEKATALCGLAGFLIFCGAIGKSAQAPLHIWLPDAMEGPTPVSALIHAATMVAAGVYMLCRVFFLIEGTWAMEAIAWIGGITSLMAALMAVQQDDIKRILAYSTLSQLGYMVMVVGLGGETNSDYYKITNVAGTDAAMFHLTTHAFFKAMLFLGAGSVIYACHHEQDIWKMGGLCRQMPRTYWTFLIGTLALCGVPLFSGFFSKEAILTVAYKESMPLFLIAVAVAVLTTFYMTRLFLVAFCGEPRSKHAEHAKESPVVMTVPLLILAVPSVVAGYFNMHAPDPLILFASVIAVVFGALLANSIYRNATDDPLPVRIGFIARAMKARFWFDEIYQWFIDKVQERLAKLADIIDRWIIAGLLVRGAHGSTELAGRVLRLAQTGNLQTYAFWFAAGLAAVMVFALS